MVKLISVIIFNKHDLCKPTVLYSDFHLADYGFFQRPTVMDICIFASHQLTDKSTGETDAVLNYMEYNVYIRMLKSGLSVTCVTDDEYPTAAARSFINKTLNIFISAFPDEDKYNTFKQDISLNIPSIDKLLILAQNPGDIDKISAIKAELEDSKDVIVKTIDDLLTRGETLDDLLKRTDDLTEQSKIFIIKTDKSCCILF